MTSTFHSLAQKFQHNTLLMCTKEGKPLKFFENCQLIRGEKFIYSQMASFQPDGTVLAFNHLSEYIHCVIKPLTETLKERFNEASEMAYTYFNNEPFLDGQVVLYTSQHEALNEIAIIHENKIYNFYIGNAAWKKFDFITYKVKQESEVKISG